jgi:DNA-binding winged helix-turn-helix (wHTH) protein
MFWSRIDPPSESASLRTGRLAIDRSERTAELGGRRLDLSPLLFDLLACLVERPGRLVSRAALKRALWPHAERIDTERRLNTAVRALRVALSDDGESPRFIETVRSHGYRWIGAEQTARTRLVAPALAIMVAAGAVLASAGPAERPAEAMALVEAQAAVDSWRQQPTAANLTRAAASVERAGDGADVPAIHLLRAQLALEGRWDWSAAEAHYRRALALDENNADAQLGLAWLEANRGNTGRALGLVEQLTAGSALTEDRRANLGWLLIRLDRPDLAAATCRASEGSSVNLLSCAHVALAATGRMDDARDTALSLMRKVGASPHAIAQLRTVDATAGYARFLQWRAEHFLPENAPWFQRAQVLADAGYGQQALDALGRSVAAREPFAIKIGSTPSFASLRADRRFRRLAAQVGVRV